MPLREWNGIPDITQHSEKDENFAQDRLLQKMDIRVCNVAYYFGNIEKLIEDIQRVRISFWKAFKYWNC